MATRVPTADQFPRHLWFLVTVQLRVTQEGGADGAVKSRFYSATFASELATKSVDEFYESLDQACRSHLGDKMPVVAVAECTCERHIVWDVSQTAPLNMADLSVLELQNQIRFMAARGGRDGLRVRYYVRTRHGRVEAGKVQAEN